MNYKELLGNIIDVGGGRIVYENLDDPATVIKVQRPKTLKRINTLSNRIEWKLWTKYKNTSYEKLLCPCKDISNDSVYLIQYRAQILEPGKHLKRSRNTWIKLPQEIRVLPDSGWYKNWGMLEGRYVIVDYGRDNPNRINRKINA